MGYSKKCKGHKTYKDHSHLYPGAKKRVWKCSRCEREGPWFDGWSRYGAIECRGCGHEIIEAVYCSQCTPKGVKFLDE